MSRTIRTTQEAWQELEEKWRHTSPAVREEFKPSMFVKALMAGIIIGIFVSALALRDEAVAERTLEFHLETHHHGHTG